ncbi:MAG: metallophosphoesterase family protein [Lysobacterales bacterium]
MLKNIVRKFRRPPKPQVIPFVPKNRRIYCIGDIHGRADLLKKLHKKIQADAKNHKGRNTMVYLGDYVDRGEQSRQVIDILLAQTLEGFDAVFLRGNHERAMLDFIDFPGAGAAWLTFGGREALKSYGIRLASISKMQQLGELAQQLDDALPAKHRDFLTKTCKDSWRCGSYYFVHAGIRPGVPLDKQTQEDKLWIRDEFLGSTVNHGYIVVHGHSITYEPEMLPNRIGIDTGAYDTGILTCLVLQGNEQRLLQTGKP